MFIIISMTFTIATSVPLLRRPWLFAIVGVITCTGYLSKSEVNRYYIWLLLYALVVVINFLTGDTYFNTYLKVFFEITYLFVPVVMYKFVLDNNERFRWIFIVFSIFLVECAIVSIIAENVFPGIIRLQSNDDSISGEISAVTFFRKYGMSNYLLPHALPVLIPAITYYIKKNLYIKTYKSLLWGVLLLLSALAIVYVSNSTTAIIISFFVLFVSILINPKKQNNTIIVLFLLLMPIFFIPSIQSAVLSILVGDYDNELLSSRITDLVMGIEQGESIGDMATRSELYKISTDNFLESFMFGTNMNGYGGHSAILDRLATLGLFGMIPWFVYTFMVFRYTLKTIPSDSKQFYYVGVIAAFTMLFMKNMSNWSLWCSLLFLLPGGLLLGQCDNIKRR